MPGISNPSGVATVDTSLAYSWMLQTTSVINDGTYIYLQGCVGTVAGSWVTFDENSATILLTANAVGRVAIAQAATNTTGKYGWYLINGTHATAACDTVTSGRALYIDGTTGRVDDDTVAGDLILNAFSTAASSANQVAVRINNPYTTDIIG